MLEVIGILDAEPEILTKKQERQSSWKKTCIVKINDDIERYYCWFMQRRFNLTLNKTIRGSHITIVNDRVDDLEAYNRSLEQLKGTEVHFTYNPSDIRSNGQHWWLKVHSEQAKDIREKLGFVREPYNPFHLTLGFANEKNEQHSKYILEQIMKFDL